MTDSNLVDPGDDPSLSERLSNSPDIGLDTEFIREKTFFSRLCLIQISFGEDIVCVDPIKLPSADTALSERFWQNLADTNWVLHSGRQDIEVLYQTSGLMPRHVFDTQIAAALLGYQPQIGYAAMVADFFDVTLEKSHTRADWSRRPLPDAFMQYATDDVLYLLPARDCLMERLAELGRVEWALEDSANLLQPKLYEVDAELAIQKLKGAGRLRGAYRSAARALATWRENQALRSNRPRQWIIRDPVLLEMATTQPQTLSDLQEISGLGRRTVERAGNELLNIIAAAGDEPDDYVPPSRPDEKQKKRLKEMQRRVTACAEQLGIATEIIAPKKELSNAMLGDREGRVFTGWRKSVIGDDLLGLL